MKFPCPACGESNTVEQPGDYTCPHCGRPFSVEASLFRWDSGVHLANDEVIDQLIAEGSEKSPTTQEITPQIASVVAPGVVAPIQTAEPATDICESCHQRPVVRACAACNRLVCEDCAAFPSPTLAGCAACYREPGVEFDDMTSSTFLSLLFPTIREIVFRPGEFFDRLRIPGPLWPAIIFGVVVALPGGIVTNLSNMLFQSNVLDTLASFNINIPDEFKTQMSASTGFSAMTTVFTLIFIPAGLFIGYFLNGAIVHLMLMMLGGANGKMEDTIRVVGYSGVTSIAQIVPFLGPLVAYVWNIVVVSIGLSRVHQIPGWKAVAAILIPVVFCCCVVAGIVITIAAVAGFAGVTS